MALKSLRQAAETWGVSVHTARRLAAEGLVQTVNVRRRRLISETEIARIEQTGVPSSSSMGNLSGDGKRLRTVSGTRKPRNGFQKAADNKNV